MKRLPLLVVALALVVGLALPVGVAGASSGPERGLEAICARDGGTWDEGSLICEGHYIEASQPVNAICEKALNGLVFYLATIEPGHGIIPNGWGCSPQ